jgi:hypothetical protein
LASPDLEAILAAMFEAEFSAPEQKHNRERVRDKLLQEQAAKSHIPWERLKFAIQSSRYIEYRRNRLAHELPSVPPKLRNK